MRGKFSIYLQSDKRGSDNSSGSEKMKIEISLWLMMELKQNCLVLFKKKKNNDLYNAYQKRTLNFGSF